MALLRENDHVQQDLHTVDDHPVKYRDGSEREMQKESTNGSLRASQLPRWDTARFEISPSRRQNTAYLDGLRGFAALLVYSLHHQGWAHGLQGMEILENGFGWNKQHYFVCLPFVRIFFSGGHLGVAIFFIISGYVLSAGPLRAIQSGNTSSMAERIGSALFRRWFRLFIPIAATTFVWMTSWHLLGIRNNSLGVDPPERTYRDEIWKWYCDFKNFSFVFTGEATNAYNAHTWTIPYEFRGSLVVYTTVIALQRVSTARRLICEVVLAWYFMYVVDGWFCCLFTIGLIFCDLDLLAANNELPELLRPLSRTPPWVYYVLFVISLYLGGIPSYAGDIYHLRKSPGWYWLSFLKPQAVFDFRWFYRTIAATLAMISIPRIPALRAFFETSFCQYLGKISFSFYLVHGPVLSSLGDRIYAATGLVREENIAMIPQWINFAPFPNWGPFGLEVNYLAAHLILLPVTLWLADLVTRTIDEPSMRFSKWLYDLAIDKGEEFKPEGKL